MLTIRYGDITKQKDLDFICNAANGVGPMGSGVAGAIRRAGGVRIQTDAFRVCKEQNPKEGDIYVTHAGTLPYQNVVHLVTMKNPGGNTTYDIVEECLWALVRYCNDNNIHKIALPALGTGVGKLNKKEVAKRFIKILEPVDNIEFVVIDVDRAFIDAFSYREQ